MIFSSLTFLYLIAAVHCNGIQPLRTLYMDWLNESRKDYPFMVSIEHRNDHICGGSIIASNLVLTAGHCIDVRKNNLKDYKIRAGAFYPGFGGELAEIKGVIKHPKYNSGPSGGLPYEYDIGVVKLKKDLEFSDTVNAITISENSNFNKNQVYTLGHDPNIWIGVTGLKKTKVPIIDFDSCNDKWLRFDLNQDSMSCTENNEIGICNVGTGGPLMILDNDEYKVIGITSVGYRCNADLPGIFTKISSVINWINELIYNF